MALMVNAWRFIDSHDGYTAAELTTRYTYGTINSIITGFGGRKAFFNPSCGISAGQFPGGAIVSKRVVVGELQLRTTSEMGSSTFPMGSIITGSTTQVTWFAQLDGSIQFFRPGGGGTTIYTTPAGVVRAGVWQHICIDFVMDTSTNGSIQVYVNNLAIGSGSGGINTCNTTDGAFNWTTVQRGGGGFSTYTGQDYYIWNPGTADSLPTIKVYKISRVQLTGDGALVQFTSQTVNNNWQNVNDATQDGDTSTNKSTSRGNIDLATIATISTGNTVVAYQISVAGRLADAGSAGLQIVQRQSGVNYTGNTGALGGAYVYNPTQLFENTPAAAGMADATLSALQVGYKDVNSP